MILYAERVSRWNNIPSKRKLNKQKINNNNNNKHIHRKDTIVLYVGTSNRYIMEYFCEFCGIWMAEFREELVQRSTNFKDKNMLFVNAHISCWAYFYLDHFRHSMVLFITVIHYTSKGFKRF